MAFPVLPLLAIGIAAAWLGTRSSSSSSSARPLRTWAGTAGPLAWHVERSGASWSWYVESVGAGSEPTAVAAMTAALRAAQESGKLGPSAGFQVASPDFVVGSVERLSVGSWEAAVTSNASPMSTSTASTRGAAALAMLEQLEPYTDGRA